MAHANSVNAFVILDTTVMRARAKCIVHKTVINAVSVDGVNVIATLDSKAPLAERPFAAHPIATTGAFVSMANAFARLNLVDLIVV